MKKIFTTAIVLGLFATAILSCQSNKKEKSISDTVAIDPAQAAIAEVGNPDSATNRSVVDKAGNLLMETPKFANEEVNKGFLAIEDLKKEFIVALKSKNPAEVKRVTLKFNAWATDAATWGNKLPKEQVQSFIDYYTKVTTDFSALAKKY